MQPDRITSRCSRNCRLNRRSIQNVNRRRTVILEDIPARQGNGLIIEQAEDRIVLGGIRYASHSRSEANSFDRGVEGVARQRGYRHSFRTRNTVTNCGRECIARDRKVLWYSVEVSLNAPVRIDDRITNNRCASRTLRCNCATVGSVTIVNRKAGTNSTKRYSIGSDANRGSINRINTGDRSRTSSRMRDHRDVRRNRQKLSVGSSSNDHRIVVLRCVQSILDRSTLNYV